MAGRDGTSSAQLAAKYDKIGQATFSGMPKVNAELLTLTYGAVVTQLIKDYESADDVNKQ